VSIKVHRAIFYIILLGGMLEGCRDSPGLIHITPLSTPQDSQVTATPEIQPAIIEIPGYEFPQSINIELSDI
jgi:hypothetical protein